MFKRLPCNKFFLVSLFLPLLFEFLTETVLNVPAGCFGLAPFTVFKAKFQFIPIISKQAKQINNKTSLCWLPVQCTWSITETFLVLHTFKTSVSQKSWLNYSVYTHHKFLQASQHKMVCHLQLQQKDSSEFS